MRKRCWAFAVATVALSSMGCSIIAGFGDKPGLLPADAGQTGGASGGSMPTGDGASATSGVGGATGQGGTSSSSTVSGGGTTVADGASGAGGEDGGRDASSEGGGSSPDGGGDPCIGITCNTPPANSCPDGAHLKAYDTTGTCSAGTCSYGTQTVACTCVAGACTTDPCAMVMCNVPPATTCADAMTRRAYGPIGTCSGGSCSYAPVDTQCSFGCANGACKPDPCSGVTCNAPPSNACQDGTHLKAYDTPGTCSAGTCSYGSHVVTCPCAGGACSTDPCASVTCNTPPAATCLNATTVRTYASTGTCSAGSCTYSPTDAPCSFGCSNGACRTDPCAGVSCNSPPAAICTNTTTKRTYASTGTCSGGSCTYASSDASCGTNQLCGGGICSVCKSDATCGSGCTPCTGNRPKCKDLGTTSACVACLTSSSCGGATPDCNAATNACVECTSGTSCVSGTCNTNTNTCFVPQPNCSGVAATCGPSGNESCCASSAIPGGTFFRSYDGVTWNDKSFPATVSSFRLDKYEITVGRFREFLKTGKGTQANPPATGAGAHPNIANSGWDSSWNGRLEAGPAAMSAALMCYPMYQTWTSTPGSNENRPLNCLTWYEAFAFCSWDGGFLPSEAEWNYAAAGGADQRVYPWGATDPGANTALAVYGCYYNGTGTCTGVQNIAPVGSSPAGNGKWGQADLAGNVDEWNLDWHQSPYPNPCTDCAVLQGGTDRVIAGSSFGVPNIRFMQASLHSSISPTLRTINQGARCARVP